MDQQFSVEDLSPKERAVLVASCQLEDSSPDGRVPVINDPDYAQECEHLVELDWLERVELEGTTVGYRLSRAARMANGMQTLIETAQHSRN